jgi:hypothetical protein
MKKRILALIMLLVTATFAAEANPIDMTTAREVAMKFMNANSEVPLRGAEDLQLVTIYNISRGDAAFYVFNTLNGFVIVSADDCASPILGYSNEGQFGGNDMPLQLQDYLQDFVEQIQYGIVNHVEADEATARQWELVRSIGRLTEQRATTAVAPLLTDTWHQVCYYNEKCPEDSTGYCGHAVTGCVATSFAQIMHYWGYPVTGRGSHTYKPTRYPQQTANFGATTYDWANMPDSLTSSSTSAQINAVATLIWHCGVAVNMKYGPDGSSARSSDIPAALKDYFGYSTELSMISRSNFTNENWLARMKGCLDMGYPIHYSAQDANGGAGHAFVCDGYDSNDLLHFNWGWGGSCNGYYSIGAMNAGSHAYTRSNGAIVNIHPDCNSGTSNQVSVMANPSNGGIVNGAGIYDCGEVCTLTATVAEGYAFDNWTKDGAVVSCFPTCELFVTDSAEYVANFRQVDGILIGEAAHDNSNLPTYNYLSLSEQIYTAEEIGMEAGEISSVSFFNTGYSVTREFSVYMVNTSKTAFENPTDWISVEDADLVFSGDVTLVSKDWTTIYFNTPFHYDGTSNIALIIDDNKNGSNVSTKCRTFNTDENQALYINSSGTDYDPYNPTGYTGTLRSEKNQIILGIPSYEYTVTVIANPEEGGEVSGGGNLYYYGQPVSITATANEGYVLNKWTRNDEVISCLSSDYVRATETAECVANFQEVDGIAIGEATFANTFLPTCNYLSLSEQIYTAEEIGMEAGEISSVAFFNVGSNSTRNFSIYMVNTAKTAFDSSTDWISVEEADLVFNGNVTLVSKDWTTIYFNTPFNYDGTSNIALIIDDNRNYPNTVTKCRAFGTEENQALFISGSGTDYDPYNPTGYLGTLMTEKNQIIFGMPSYDCAITISASPVEGGIVSGGEGLCYYGQPIPIGATTNEGYVFNSWTKNNEVVSYFSFDYVSVTETAEYVANFQQVEGIVIGDAVHANSNLPTGINGYSLIQQIYTGDEMGNEACGIYSVAFFNTSNAKTRQFSIYMVNTDKTTFASSTDWITVEEEDLVFSGSVTLVGNDWTTIYFNKPFNYDGTSNVALILDDNSNSYGLGLKCRTFDAAGNQVLRVSATNVNYDPCNPNGYTGTLLSVKNQVVFGFEVESPQVQQSIMLSQGWNWFSTYIEVDDPVEMLQMLEAALGENGVAIKSSDVYTENDAEWGWFGDLDDVGIVNEQMYKIQVSASCTLNLQGTPANPADHPITINPGWNWMGFPCSETMSLDDAFEGFAQDGDIIRNSDGETPYDPEWGGWYGDFETLEPGQGYMYYSASSTSKTLVFPASAK